MDINKYIEKNTLKIIVKPNSSKNKILNYNKEKKALKIAIKAHPEKGLANKELIKFLSKLLKKKIEIKSGKTSKQKIIKIKEQHL